MEMFQVRISSHGFEAVILLLTAWIQEEAK